MAILVSHNTALEMLRSVPPQLGALPRVDHPVALEGVRARARDVHAANLRELGVRRSPTHVLLPADEREIRSADVRSHRTRLDVVPEGLLLRAAPGVYVAGPELCFIQMAGVTSRVGAVVLGYELCGEYAHFSELVSGYYEREPLTARAWRARRSSGCATGPARPWRPWSRPRCTCPASCRASDSCARSSTLTWRLTRLRRR